MASSKRKQDEKNLKLLRELGSQTSNRTCFDCHQKGPTYINMTIGSFVCTSCSGILRGLNPPHRVKSISMASFTQEEIDQIKARGNQYCEAVWLGLYDEKSNLFPDSKDEQKIRDFMISKYEKKRFYVEPSIATRNLASQITKSDSSSNASTPGSDSRSMGVTSNGTTPPSTSVSRPTVSAQNSFSSPSSNGLAQLGKLKPSSSVDLLSGVSASASQNSDPFAPQQTISAPDISSQSQESGFANFENASIYSSTTGAFSANSHPSPLTQLSFAPNPLTPMSGNCSTQAMGSSALGGTAAATSATASAAASAGTSNSGEDRYAALKDLDEAFKFQKEKEKDLEKPPSNTSTMYGGPSSSPFGNNLNGAQQPPKTSSGSLFGTSPVSGGAFFNQSSNQSWNPSFPPNPFSGAPSNSNKTPTSPWTNGTPGFSNAGQTQPNPFAGGPDPNFNSPFPGGMQLNGTNNLGGNANWANFGPQQSNTPTFTAAKMAPNPWGSEASANPFTAASQLPTSGTSYNPFL